MLVVMAYMAVMLASPQKKEEDTPPAPEAEGMDAHPSSLLSRLHANAALALTTVCLLYGTTINAATQVTICVPTSSTLRVYLALKQSGAQLAMAPTLEPWRALLTGAGTATLLARFSIGEAPLEALPSALQDASADILAAPLDYRVLAGNPFLVCSEGAHVAVNAVGCYIFVCLVIFPAFTFFFVRLALLRRMGDPAVVGVPTAEHWNSGGLRAHYLPLPPLLECLVGDPSAPARTRQPHPASSSGEGPQLTEQESREVEELNLSYTLNPLVARAALASLHEAASLRSARLAWEEGRKLSREASALLDRTPSAFDHPTAPLIKPWTVGERLPSVFFFKQLDQLVLYLLTIPAAFNASRTVGASSLPYAQAATLNAFLLLAIVVLMGLSAWAAMRFSLFRDFDMWKRNALVAVCGLTALAGAINFVSWLKEEGGVAGLDGLLLGLTALLFGFTLLLLLYLVRGFFSALEHASKAEAQAVRDLAAELEALKARGREPKAGGLAAHSVNPLFFFRAEGAVAGKGSLALPAGKALPIGRGRQYHKSIGVHLRSSNN